MAHEELGRRVQAERGLVSGGGRDIPRLGWRG